MRLLRLFSLLRRHALEIILLSLLVLFCLFAYVSTGTPNSLYHEAHTPSPQTITRNLTTRPQAALRVVKATTLYPRSNKIYQDALALQKRHNEKFGYTMHLLQKPIMRGGLNTVLWLQWVITEELMKDDHCAEWILYFDPSVILVDTNFSLHILLPPLTDLEAFDSLSIIATKPDGSTLSSRVFFIRVHPASLKLLSETAVEIIHGDDNKIGSDVVAAAMQRVLERDENRKSAIFQPSEWYNQTSSLMVSAIFEQPWAQTHVERLGALRNTIDEAEKEDTDEQEAHIFWHSITEARRVLLEARDRGHTAGRGQFMDMVKDLKEHVELRSWEIEDVDGKVKVLKKALEWD